MQSGFYVSRGPWGIYEMLDEFFHVHEIPVGPILFLREWGVRLTSCQTMARHAASLGLMTGEERVAAEG